MRAAAEAALACALAAGVAAQAPPADVVTTVEGERLSGTLTGIDAQGIVRLRDAAGELRELALDRVQRIELRPREGAAARPRRDTVWLRSGQALPLPFAGGDANEGRFARPYGEGELALPWRYMRAVVLSDGEIDPDFAAALREPPEDRDLLYAQQGDGEVRRLSVEFLGVDGDRVRVRFAGEERTVALERVYGVVFARRSGAAPDALPNPRVRLLLSTGRELEGKVVALDADRCRLMLDEGMQLDVPAALLTRLAVRSDKLVDLTELEPKVEQTPAFDRVWPPLRNRGPGGGPIRLGGRELTSGFVLVPRTRLTWDIGGRFDALEGLVGLEERAGASAHAVVRVLADGVVAFDSGPLTPGVAVQRLEVPLEGVQQLTVEADFGQNLDLGDLCVLAEPRLLRR